MPTDTIYGLVGSAFLSKAVRRIYRVRKRSPNKPCIILISDLADFKKFKVKINFSQKRFLNKYWPGKLSVILPVAGRQFAYLHRGTNSLAFRLPAKASLRRLIAKTGPLVAPSANFEGRPPATTISEAKKYFDKRADFYVDGGKLKSKASTLVDLRGKGATILREGAVKV